ncbi:DUF1906 domain-containing protein [Tomitella fengzijianii]|uniref:DUF1906 domain-containing protein n=1 Tax=Tomitella fengzijianii TaxID=2597660 RepID=A0A516X2F1_9ACTN|nr:DUF1906 domain-containing protein [Tomitella fengzijianii]
MELSRRDALRTLVTGATAAAGLAFIAAPAARAEGLGTLIDYSAGVPSARSIRAAGYKGAIRYCSDARADWMTGKPMARSEADALQDAGLEVVSCYQYGKGDTSDWLGGHDAGVHHATRGLELHRAAGGAARAPIYMSIDSNPTRAQFDAQVLPFLQGCESVLGHGRTGVYCNAPTIDWALAAGVGAYFWQHDWGSDGRIHDAAHLHQRAIDSDKVDGVGIDLNTIRKSDYGQWSAHGGPTPHPDTSVTQTAPGTGDAPPEQTLGRLSQSAGDPGALFGNADHLIDRATGLADRAIGLAGRLAARIG